MLQEMVRLPRVPHGERRSRNYEGPRDYPRMQKVQESVQKGSHE